MMQRSLVFLTVLLLSNVLLGQDADGPVDVASAYEGYFKMPRESVYLHLNKDKYVQGESIWFSGYVYDRRSGIPFEATTNIYVGIYDSIGNYVDKRLFMGNKGYFKGSMALDSTYSKGSYYIRAETNWMRNFKEDNAYVQKIRVYAPGQGYVEPLAVKASYDVQFLPEGGNLITGVENNVAVKILNGRGYGVKVRSINIRNSSGELVTTTETNDFGLGKFGLTPRVGKGYRADIVYHDGHKDSYPLPMALLKGISVKVFDNPYQEKVGVVFNTNAVTLGDIAGRQFYFLLHKDGVFEKSPVVFTDDSPSVSFFLDKKDIKVGVNTVTLFDEDGTPVLERMFFNRESMDFPEVEINVSPLASDSLLVRLKGASSGTRLSVSVLPTNTISYSHADNIFSTFYLRPYLKGFIERPGHYFSTPSKEKDYELDLLLLSQGWSRYKWSDVLNGAPDGKFVFEDGMQLKGTVNTAIGNNGAELLVHPTKYHGQQVLPLSEDGKSFVLTSFFPEKDETVSVSLIDRSGKLSKPGLYLSVANQFSKGRQRYLWEDNLKLRENVEPIHGTSLEGFITDRTINLKEVVVSDSKVEKLAKTNSFVPAFIKNKVKEIDRRTVTDFPFITDIIRSLGFVVREDLVFGGFSRVQIFSRRNNTPINLVFDGFRQQNLDVLYQLPTGQVESYWVDRLSRYEGVGANNRETLYIFTRRGEELQREGDFFGKNSFELIVSNGFEVSKEFYVPKYRTYLDDAFMNFGAIHWVPDLEIDDGGTATFKILDTGLGDVSFFIEGMGAEGSLISKTVNSNLKNIGD